MIVELNVTTKLGYKSVAGWIRRPKMLTDEQKIKRMDSALTLLTRLIYSNLAWFYHHIPEPKQQSLQ